MDPLQKSLDPGDYSKPITTRLEKQNTVSFLVHHSGIYISVKVQKTKTSQQKRNSHGALQEG